MSPNKVASLLFSIPAIIILIALTTGFWQAIGWLTVISFLVTSGMLWNFPRMYKNMQEGKDKWK